MSFTKQVQKADEVDYPFTPSFSKALGGWSEEDPNKLTFDVNPVSSASRAEESESAGRLAASGKPCIGSFKRPCEKL